MMQLSDHANEQLASRHITETDVAEALSIGARWDCNQTPGIHYARLNDLFVVLHGRGDWVITSYRLEH